MSESCAAMETLIGAAVYDQRIKSFEAKQSYMNGASWNLYKWNSGAATQTAAAFS